MEASRASQYGWSFFSPMSEAERKSQRDMPAMPSGKFRTNLTLSMPTHQWLKEHSIGEKGMGELVDQLVLKERLLRPLEDRVAALEALITQPQRRKH
jgi:hypothetical protein